MKGDRQVAGLWCHEVLEQLFDYIDGEVDAAARGAIEGHLAECSVCARFGGEAAALAGAIQTQLRESDPISDTLQRKLLSTTEADPPAET